MANGGNSPSGPGAPKLSSARRVDAVCDRFEAAWKDGERPRIVDYLATVAAADRPALLRELQALERELLAADCAEGVGDGPDQGPTVEVPPLTALVLERTRDQVMDRPGAIDRIGMRPQQPLRFLLDDR